MTAVDVCPVAHGQVNLFDRAFIDSPQGLLAELRESAPIHFDEITGCSAENRE